MRMLIILLLIFISGCNGNDSGPSEAEVREMIRSELRSEHGRQIIEQATTEQQLRPLVEDFFRSPEGRDQMMQALEQAVESPEIQTKMQEIMEEIVKAPELQTTLSELVTEELMDILRRGTEQEG